jgi:hypothetical protein
MKTDFKLNGEIMLKKELKTGKSELLDNPGIVLEADKYFKCTDRERAAFEAGIKLGGIYHQFIGTPVSAENVDVLEQSIMKSTLVQPFVENIELHIARKDLKNKSHQYDYKSLTADMLDIQITLRYKGTKIIAEMRNIKALEYPLMYISLIE